MIKIAKKITVGILAIVVIVGCGEKIPIKELANARRAISKAMMVKAEKYAPKLLESSKNKLFAAHDLIKKDKLKEVLKSAQESQKLAEDAYKKAAPLLAKDSIAVADKSIKDAEIAFAEKLATDDYNDAIEILKKAKELNSQKKYYEAYLKAVEADKKAKNAKNIAIGKKDILKDSIDEVQLTITKSKHFNSEKYDSETLKLAEENIIIAQQAFNDLKLKKCNDALEIAKLNADKAYLSSLKSSALNDNKQAKEKLKIAEDSEGSQVAQEELKGAKESLQKANDMIAKENFKDSIAFSRESLRLAEIVISTKKPVEIKEVDDQNKNNANQDANKNKEKVNDYILYKVRYRARLKDCLWRIADKYYVNPKLWKKIYKANKKRIRNPNLIYPGWILKIPRLETKLMKK